MLTRGLTLLAFSIVLACKPETRPPAEQPDAGAAATGVEVRVDRTEYRPGDQVKLTIVNHDAVQYAFNPCTRVLEQSSGGQWQPAPEPDRVCTMEAWLLDPGISRDATTELPAALSPGEYRLVIAFSRQTPEGGAVQGASPAFQVQ